MESQSVLTALDELRKWRDRRARLEAQLAEVRRQGRILDREIEAARRRLARATDAVLRLVERTARPVTEVPLQR